MLEAADNQLGDGCVAAVQLGKVPDFLLKSTSRSGSKPALFETREVIPFASAAHALFRNGTAALVREGYSKRTPSDAQASRG